MLFKLILFVILLSSIQLFAYSKRVLIASFSLEENADRAFELIDTRLGSHPKIVSLEQKGITFYKKRSGKYHIITLEPFNNSKDLHKALDVVKKYYKNAYFIDILSKKPKVKSPLETTIILNLPQKRSLLFRELGNNITNSFHRENNQTEVNSMETMKIELLSQTSMDAYLQEMKAYKKELNHLKETSSAPTIPSQNQKKEFQFQLNINDFLISIALLMLLFYALKFTLKK